MVAARDDINGERVELYLPTGIRPALDADKAAAILLRVMRQAGLSVREIAEVGAAMPRSRRSAERRLDELKAADWVEAA
jgi:hypothetical protein